MGTSVSAFLLAYDFEEINLGSCDSYHRNRHSRRRSRLLLNDSTNPDKFNKRCKYLNIGH
jgi:hypothetical protein